MARISTQKRSPPDGPLDPLRLPQSSAPTATTFPGIHDAGIREHSDAKAGADVNIHKQTTPKSKHTARGHPKVPKAL
jgi:hypothetical protein